MPTLGKTLRWIAMGLSLIVCGAPLIAAHKLPKKAIEFFVVIPSYNNNKVDSKGKNWIEKNLESVFKQTNKHWTLCYINDCSKDDTGKVAERYATKRGMLHKCRFINNEVNKGALTNLYSAISQCDPKKVVILLDGDDELVGNKVFDILAKQYRDPNVWMTYGSYRISPGGGRGIGKPIPAKVLQHRRYRASKFVTSHLRTFYAKLFQSIKKEHLMYQGKFFRGGWDLIILMPMVDMCAQGHVKFIRQVLYKWNNENPLSDCRVHSEEQKLANEWVRAQPPYAALKGLFPEAVKVQTHYHRKHTHQQEQNKCALGQPCEAT